MIFRLTSVIVGVFLAVLTAGSVQAVEADGRPTIGLVLGGGAAKGLSHVGVIQVLEENQIPVDVIAGTSIGAVIGSLYASGYSSNEINTIARELDWSEIFNDDPNRANSLFRRKSNEEGFLTDLKLAFDNGKLVLPAGLIEGQTLYLELSRLLTRSFAVEDFSDLARPFRAVATDLSTGRPVVMQDGNLVSAVFASMAIPGFIPPVERENKYLIDGAFSNNLPIDQVLDMGADIVIVVDLGTDPRPAEDLSNVLDVIRQLQILLTIGNSDAQRANVRSQDILIDPALSEIAVTDFGKTEMTVSLGIEAAERMLPQLNRLRLSKSEWEIYKRKTDKFKPAAPRIDRIVISQDTRLSDKILRAGLSIAPGDTLDVDALNQDISKLYDDGVFDRIKYEVITEGRENILMVSASAKESSDGFLSVGLELDSNLKNESSFQLGVAYTKPEVNALGGEIRAEVIIGDRTDLQAEFYQPFGSKQNLLLQPGVFFSRDQDDFFDINERRRGQINTRLYGSSLEGGILFGRWGELRGGVVRQFGKIEFTEDALQAQSFSVDDAGLFARFSVDTLNDLAFPKSGTALMAEYSIHDTFLGGKAKYETFDIKGLKPLNYDRHTVLLGGRLAGVTGEDSGVLGRSNLGGFLSLSGFGQDELIGRYSASALGSYYYRLNQKSPLFDAPLFVGTSIEAGNVYPSFNRIGLDDVIYAGSIFAGADTPIGPIFLGLGYNDEGRQSLYFSIGSFF